MLASPICKLSGLARAGKSRPGCPASIRPLCRARDEGVTLQGRARPEPQRHGTRPARCPAPPIPSFWTIQRFSADKSNSSWANENLPSTLKQGRCGRIRQRCRAACQTPRAEAGEPSSTTCAISAKALPSLSFGGTEYDINEPETDDITEHPDSKGREDEWVARPLAPTAPSPGSL